MMQKTAREAALMALERCRRDKAWSGASIDNIIKKYSLDSRDAALASRLCLGVLQNSSYCDYYIDKYYKGSGIEPKLRDILRLGVYQLLFLDKIPARAAVNESVVLCKSMGYKRAAGLVNAVLRRIAENKDNLPDIEGKGSARYLSIKYSHPEWLVNQIIDQEGYDFAEDFFAANNIPPSLAIQINTLKVKVDDYKRALARMNIDFSAVEALPGCIILKGGNVTDLPGYEDGLFYVQDPAARAAVEIAGAKPGMSILDACSAPGGKSFAASIAMENCGKILSCDIHEKKLKLINSGAERLGIGIINTEVRDARVFDDMLNESFDIVIADVPCSGLGVIRKKPEIRNKSFDEINKLPEIQKDVIKNLAKYVKVGGVLLYSTCTVLNAENKEIVEYFLEQNDDFKLEKFKLGNIVSETGMYAFWPNKDKTDGFFVAKLRRIRK